MQVDSDVWQKGPGNRGEWCRVEGEGTTMKEENDTKVSTFPKVNGRAVHNLQDSEENSIKGGYEMGKSELNYAKKG